MPILHHIPLIPQFKVIPYLICNIDFTNYSGGNNTNSDNSSDSNNSSSEIPNQM